MLGSGFSSNSFSYLVIRFIIALQYKHLLNAVKLVRSYNLCFCCFPYCHLFEHTLQSDLASYNQIAASMHQDREQTQVTSIFGIYFCQRCRNMMAPSKANGNLLEFNCQTCGSQEIDFSKRFNEDCLLYTKELQTCTRKYVSDESHIFDPTMPMVEVTCPECGYGRAIYCVTPDENETKMVAKMTCASVTGTVSKCGHTWELEETEGLFQNRVVNRLRGAQRRYDEEEYM